MRRTQGVCSVGAGGRRGARERRRPRGFTLIEILIVITIIALLAGLVIGGVSAVRKTAARATASSTIDSLNSALKMFESDKGHLPGRGGETSLERNDMPAVLNALLPKLDGGEGYLELNQDDVFTYDEDGTLRQVTREEFYDPSVKKYLVDPWDEVYIARENRSKKKKDLAVMRQVNWIDLISKGPNRKEGDEDDIAN